mmetsp:Transcript_32916/g.49825  ORF Transcript_32916/g.49825 Transcript_32916/m.49825 type:complete len:122 (-) Transcript_32916:128-493(-)
MVDLQNNTIPANELVGKFWRDLSPAEQDCFRQQFPAYMHMVGEEGAAAPAKSQSASSSQPTKAQQRQQAAVQSAQKEAQAQLQAQAALAQSQSKKRPAPAAAADDVPPWRRARQTPRVAST